MRKIFLILMTSVAVSCQNSPEAVVKQYYQIANQVVKGETSHENYLKEHLSKNALQQMDSLPLLMQYSLLAITKRGTLKSTEIIEKKSIKADSVLLKISLIYMDSSRVNINQAMILENNQWKLGVSAKSLKGK